MACAGCETPAHAFHTRVSSSTSEPRRAVLLFAEKDKGHKDRLARALYALDTAKDVIGARELLVICVDELWQTAGVKESARYTGAGTKLKILLGGVGANGVPLLPACPPLVAYMSLVSKENNLPAASVLQHGADLYKTLSKDAHAPLSVADGNPRLSVGVLSDGDRPGLAALGAIVRFTGRNLELYGLDGPDAGALKLPDPATPCP